jgi:hypothetical protein
VIGLTETHPRRWYCVKGMQFLHHGTILLLNAVLVLVKICVEES